MCTIVLNDDLHHCDLPYIAGESVFTPRAARVYPVKQDKYHFVISAGRA